MTESTWPGGAAAEARRTRWSVAGALDRAARYLGRHGLESPRLDAELLLAHTLGLRRLDLYLEHDRLLAEDQATLFGERVRRRAAREPVQYILGEAPFRHLTLRVTPAVLIPRPETERLVDEILAWLRAAGAEAPSLLDVGTGCGAVALACLHELAGLTAVATDVSPAALAVAAANARAAGLAGRLELREGDLFAPIAPGERFDAVAANLPYVGLQERASLADEVRVFEPPGALFAGPEGLDLLERLVAGAPERLRPGGLLAFEIAPPQLAQLRRRVQATPGLRYIAAYSDDTHRARGVLAARLPLDARLP